jgi:5-methylcytosine-specific restriction endonuclease McrA
MSKRRDYGDPVYKEFRQKVLKRDNFQCQMCNKKGKRVWLNVHHIIKWSSASHLRYDTDNGITLCKACHNDVTGKESHYISYFHEKIRGKRK